MSIVGVVRLELTTSCSQSRHASQLRHTPYRHILPVEGRKSQSFYGVTVLVTVAVFVAVAVTVAVVVAVAVAVLSVTAVGVTFL